MVARPARRFRHGRADRSAFAGETLLEALSRDGVPKVVRSVRYHRPRGPFCGTGDCTGCLVRVNGRPNVRACVHPVGDGDRVDRGNGWPSASFDLLGAIDLVTPHGIDTLRGFRRPAWAHGLYHRVIRRLAGYGEAPDSAAGTAIVTGPRAVETEVAVIGAGASGRAAAERLRERGVPVQLIDRNREIAPIDRVDTLPGTTITFVPPPSSKEERPFTLLGFEAPGRGVVVRSRSIVLATGSYDASLLFGGNDRPGVVAAELALRWARPGRSSPLRRAIVVGGGARAAEVIDRLGRSVRAVVAPTEIGPEVARRASDLGIALYPRSLILRANGRSRVRSLDLRGRGGGPRFSLAADSVILAHRRVPSNQLAVQSGAALAWRADPGAYFPAATPAGATTVPGLYAVGSVGGFDPEDSAASGTRAADALVDPTGPVATAETTPSAATGELEGYYRELLRERRSGKWIACACEDVLLEEVERASAAGFRGIEVVKRYTGLGTGLCQGRYCLPDALLLLAIQEQRPPAEVGRITQRPPAVPTPLAAFAALSGEFPSEAID
ncbi:MAG: 2Fe-2S iron-sulfur cluster-binding protein [Thermoplasmata archaeon]